MTLKGNTGEFALDTVLRLLAEAKKTGELTLRGANGSGALGVAEGRVVTAVYGSDAPIPALGAIWDMQNVEFEFTPWNDAPQANLEGELQDNLRKAEEYKQWMVSVRQVIPNDRTRFRLSERAAEQGAVTFTSDRWRVVLAVNGQRDVNALSEHLKVDRDTTLTTLAGLVRDGVIETIEPPTEPQSPPAPSPPQEPQLSASPAWGEAAPPPSRAEAAAPPPRAPEPAAPPAAQVAPEPADWTAALVEKRKQAAGASRESASESPEWTPPQPISDAPRWSAPPPAPGTEEWTPPSPLVPEETYVAEVGQDDWTPPTPSSEPPPWTASTDGPEWTPPAAIEPAPPEPAAEWSERAQADDQWTPPAPEPAQAAPSVDDRLAALDNIFGNEPAPSAQPPATEWTAPATEWAPSPANEWATSAPEPAQPAADDPRLAALLAPPPAQAPEPVAEVASPPTMPSTEWAPPPPPEAAPAPEKKKGLFGGIFGKREETAKQTASRGVTADASASSQAGLLAAFSNALLTEYNSGQYGKSRVDDRIPSLLMRVDEQADPIDRPLPVVDDRLDVQALERVGLPETQAVPYLAMLVTTIYADAEKAFGRDKAKRGYKSAQQQVFRGDASALTGLAGKLPKI